MLIAFKRTSYNVISHNRLFSTLLFPNIKENVIIHVSV